MNEEPLYVKHRQDSRISISDTEEVLCHRISTPKGIAYRVGYNQFIYETNMFSNDQLEMEFQEAI